MFAGATAGRGFRIFFGRVQGVRMLGRLTQTDQHN